QRLYIAQRDVNGRSRRITLGTVSGLTLEAATLLGKGISWHALEGCDPVFEQSCPNKKLKRDDHLCRSHRALGTHSQMKAQPIRPCRQSRRMEKIRFFSSSLIPLPHRD